MPKEWIYWLEELEQGHNDLVGKKCANLGEMSRLGLTVPEGFALCLEAYRDFMNLTGVDGKVREYVKSSVCSRELGQFKELSAGIRRIVESCPLPPEMEEVIVGHYRELCRRCRGQGVPVSVRSAGAVSHPGQYETYLNVCGEADVVKKVRKVWASTFNPRSLAFRRQKDMPLEDNPIGVAVLKMVKAAAAGVMFTADPNSGDASRITIEGNWGLGESVVNGESTPDSFVVDKASLEVVEKRLGPKSCCIMPGASGITEVKVSAEKRDAFCLSDRDVQTIARLGKRLEEHFGKPQDVEWAVDEDARGDKRIVLLQTRAEVIAQQKTPVDQIVDLMMSHFSGGMAHSGGL